MKTSARHGAVFEDSQDPDTEVQPLSAKEAKRLREQKPQISPWRVIAVQATVGLLVAVLTWGLTEKQNWGLSAGYGALTVVVPSAVLARGLMGRFSSLNAATAAAGFFLWELVKISLTVAMLFAAPRLIADLSWPALLAGLVVTMKAVWVALWWASRHSKH